MAWYNPSTWTPVDNFQNSINSISGPQPGKTAGNSGYGGFSSQPSSGYVQGASTTNQPAPQQTNAAQDTGYAGGGGGGAYVDPYAAQRNEDNAFLDSQVGFLQNLLGRADNTLNQGRTQITNNYNKELTRGNENQSRTLRDYATKQSDTEKGRESDLGKVDQNAYNLASSLRRILGMASGRSSSAFQSAAPEAVADKASEERGNVLETVGRNLRNIGTARQDAEDQFSRFLQDLAEQKSTKEYDLESQVEAQRQGYRSKLAEIAGERARVGGAGYSGIRSAQQPYLDAINSGNSRLDQLFAGSQVGYTPKAVNYQTPELSQYTVDRAAINANKQFGGGDPSSPYSYFARKKFNETA